MRRNLTIAIISVLLFVAFMKFYELLGSFLIYTVEIDLETYWLYLLFIALVGLIAIVALILPANYIFKNQLFSNKTLYVLLGIVIFLFLADATANFLYGEYMSRDGNFDPLKMRISNKYAYNRLIEILMPVVPFIYIAVKINSLSKENH